MTEPTASPRKADLRREVRARLRGLTPDLVERLGASIAAAVWELPEMAGARSLLIYASIGAEVPTDAIAAEARSRGMTLVYPRCLPGGREMTLHAVASSEELVPGGAFTIREPAAHCPVIATSAIDVALIPGLAWDRRGGRLGRGAGYYDRILAGPDWRALRCGLFFAAQELPAIPLDPWDVPLDVVLTERETLRFQGPPSAGRRRRDGQT